MEAMKVRALVLPSIAALLVMPQSSGAEELKAGPLFAMCSIRNAANSSLGCAAFTEGFVQGLAGSGAICPPPEAYKDVIADLLTLPRREIGDKSVAQVLVPRLKAKYPCSPA
ncbi:hypothetical protein KXS07_18070 [Inquilinus limosus]|uniref:hypothetical protein n=1 Tax=Inquilinus limosus TaxID=171674 RepID=UPI003F163D76